MKEERVREIRLPSYPFKNIAGLERYIGQVEVRAVQFADGLRAVDADELDRRKRPRETGIEVSVLNSEVDHAPNFPRFQRVSQHVLGLCDKRRRFARAKFSRENISL